jgi:hypothetical protein
MDTTEKLRVHMFNVLHQKELHAGLLAPRFLRGTEQRLDTCHSLEN